MTGDQQPTHSTINLNQRLDLDFALQAAGLGVWEYDPKTGLVSWDDRCRSFYGIAQTSQTTYEQAVQFVHPDDSQRIDEAVRLVINPQSGGVYDQTYRTVGADDGLLRHVRFQGRAYFDEAGEFCRFGGIAQEVTSQILYRQQVEENQRELLALFNESPAGIATISADDTLTFRFANAFYGELVGRKPETLVDKPLLEALPELTGQGFDTLLRSVIDTGVAFNATEVAVELVRSSQLETIYVDFAYQPRQAADGTVSSVFVVATDVTQQVLARQQIEKSEAKLRSLIKAAPAGIGLFMGRDLVIELPNQTFIDIVGKGPTVEGLPLREAMPELLTEGQPFLKILDDVYTTGVPFISPASLVKIVQDGVLNDNYYNISYTPIHDAAGEVYAILDIAIDVTAQVKAQQALAESEAVLANAVDLAKLGTWTMDVPTGATQLSVSHAEMFGLTITDVPYEKALAIVHPEDRERVRAAFLKAQQTGSDGHYEAEYRIINARTHRQQVIHAQGITFFDEQGKPIRITGTTQDITLERELQLALEQQVQQRTEELAATNEELAATNEDLASGNEEYAATNEELEEANMLLSRSNDNLQIFAYVASHDLQEPLRKIQQFGDLLRTLLTNSIGSEELGYLERMQAAASRMSILIRDLLSFSRISTQRSVDVPVSLQDVVSNVLSVLDMAVSEAGAQVDVAELPILSGDAVQLGQLVQNLLSNALKFRRADVPSHIRISSQRVEAADVPLSIKPTRRTAYYERIDVADNGIGFDEKYLDRIFQVFQRLHGKSQYAGTGVGLAICEKVVANHGGGITASSQPGQGATFSVYLPA